MYDAETTLRILPRFVNSSYDLETARIEDARARNFVRKLAASEVPVRVSSRHSIRCATRVGFHFRESNETRPGLASD